MQLAQHRALAEMYVLQGRLEQAIEQPKPVQRAGDGNFYDQSVVDDIRASRKAAGRRTEAEEIAGKEAPCSIASDLTMQHDRELDPRA